VGVSRPRAYPAEQAGGPVHLGWEALTGLEPSLISYTWAAPPGRISPQAVGPISMSAPRHHMFHLVEPRPWPLRASLGAGAITLGSVLGMHTGGVTVLAGGLLAVLLSARQWWRDIAREAGLQGHHSMEVEWNMRWGIVLFITSEVLFFFSFFWAYFHISLSPTIEVGLVWPPQGLAVFNPLRVPLLNTTILLTSGLTVTWAHHALTRGAISQAKGALLATVALGRYFTLIQLMEYLEAPFTLADSVYGSCFFVATGFHGLHVLIGTILLGVTIARLWRGHFSPTHHFGFEARAWYWHFVDVV
jgi:cytochrome c oxidase subunit 3